MNCTYLIKRIIMFEFEENSKKELTKVWVEKYRPKTVKECILPA